MRKWINFMVFLQMIFSAIFMTVFGGENTEGTQDFDLKYADQAGYLFIDIPFEDQEVVFSKEPDFEGRKVVRGAVPIGENPQSFLGFIWDMEKSQIYFDANQNLDLTDDPSAVFTSADEGSSDSEIDQEFENIRLSFEFGSVKVSYKARMHLWHYSGPNSNNGYIGIQSGWLGRIEMSGKQFTCAILDNMDGVIGHQDIMTLSWIPSTPGSRPPLERFTQVPQKLFLNKMNYALDFGLSANEQNPDLQLKLTEQESPTGTLEIQGEGIKRLVLLGADQEDMQVVILDPVEKKVAIPAGEFASQRITLDEGEGSGKYLSNHTESLTITQGMRERVIIGAPLTNGVKFSRNGRDLDLEYTLTGQGGETYREIQPNTSMDAFHQPGYFELDYAMDEAGVIETHNWRQELILEQIEGNFQKEQVTKTYEMAFKLPVDIKDNKVLLFGLAANDRDADNRIGTLGWSLGAYEWPRQPQYFGGLFLSGQSAGGDRKRADMSWPCDVPFYAGYKMIGYRGTPVIDGNPDDADWAHVDWQKTDMWIRAWDNPEQVSYEDAGRSLKFKFLYDETNFYMLVVTTDNVSRLRDKEKALSEMWTGDCVQMAFIDPEKIKDKFPPGFTMYRGEQIVFSNSFEYG